MAPNVGRAGIVGVPGHDAAIHLACDRVDLLVRQAPNVRRLRVCRESAGGCLPRRFDLGAHGSKADSGLGRIVGAERPLLDWPTEMGDEVWRNPPTEVVDARLRVFEGTRLPQDHRSRLCTTCVYHRRPGRLKRGLEQAQTERLGLVLPERIELCSPPIRFLRNQRLSCSILFLCGTVLGVASS